MSAENPPENNVAGLPEITPSMRRRYQQCFEHGRKLMAQPKYDFDYAFTMFSECVIGDPGNLTYVDAFLENLHRKYDNNKKGARVQLFMNRGPFKKAQQQQDWHAVLKLGPELLKTNPWDVLTLRGMAEACERFALTEVELRYLKNALDGSPRDAEVNRHCAKTLARVGQFDQSIACWARVSELLRHDAEADKMIGDLQIEKTKWKSGTYTVEERAKFLERSGLAPKTLPAVQAAVSAAAAGKKKPEEEEDPTASLLRRPKPEAVRAAGDTEEAPRKREIQLTPRQKLDRAIADDPTFVENYLKLADLHAEEGRYAEAERALTKGLQVSGNDIRVQERLEDVQIHRLRQSLGIAEKRVQVENTESAKELAKQIRSNLNRLELETYGRRSERYPANSEYKYEFGLRLKRAGNFREAMQQFLDVRDDAEREIPSLIELGECLQQLKLYPKALNAYQKAVHRSEQMKSQGDTYKLALYRTAVLAAGLQDAGAASVFEKLLAIDPNYRDARERLDKLR